MKLLIYGLAKSGTTILFKRAEKALQGREKDLLTVFEPRGRRPPSDGKPGEFLLASGNTKRERPTTLAKALLSSRKKDSGGIYWEDALQQFADYDGKIFINRDPRDRLVSSFFYRWYRGHKPDPDKFGRALALTRFKEQNPSLIPFYSLSSMDHEVNTRLLRVLKDKLDAVTRFVTAARDAGWHIMKYEDLVDDHCEALERYLGFPLAPTEEITGALARVARTKSYGNWRSWFTIEDVHFYREVIDPFLREHGYAWEDWALTPQPALSPAEGSDYMLSLNEPRPAAHEVVQKLPLGERLGRFWRSRR